ncbi:MAG: DUF2336 domain-containing protein [Pseudomonadota bacterium]
MRALREVQTLHELANDRTPEGRAQMLQTCSALLDKTLNDGERELVADILVSLLDQVDLPERQVLSGQIAANATAPRRLVVALAHDKIDVARPILSLSKRLTDQDLIYVIDHRSTGHRKIIARRPDVTRSIASALVDTGDADAVASLLYNPQIAIDEDLLSKAGDLAKDEPVLRRPLVQRQEVPADLALDLYWWVSSELKSHIHRRFEIPDEILDRALEQSFNEIMKRDGGPKEVDMEGLADRLATSGKLSPGHLIMTLRNYNLTAFTALFMQLTGLSHSAVTAMLDAENARHMAVASKASNIDRDSFSTILMLTRASGKGANLANPRELAHALEYYEQLKPETARHILTEWQQEPHFLMGGSNPVVETAEGR